MSRSLLSVAPVYERLSCSYEAQVITTATAANYQCFPADYGTFVLGCSDSVPP
jgi:hypothetical protein